MQAHSRLATLLTELSMHSSAVEELKAAIASPDVPAATRKEYEARLQTAQQAARRENTRGESQPVDHYRVLGVQRECTTEEVRKVYKKLALLLHPDKSASACRFADQMGPVGSRLAGPVAEVQTRVRDAATWLFKCLGEAHDVLTDDAKRRKLDRDLVAWSSGAYGTGGSSRWGSHEHHHHRYYDDPFTWEEPSYRPSYGYGSSYYRNNNRGRQQSHSYGRGPSYGRHSYY